MSQPRHDEGSEQLGGRQGDRDLAPAPQPSAPYTLSSTPSTEANFADDDDAQAHFSSSSTATSSSASVPANTSVCPRRRSANAAAAAPRTMGDTAAHDTAPEANEGRPATAATRPLVKTAGLINEGCTCYLNSLLQLLFHIDYLRAAVYRIPVGEEKLSIAKAMQSLFLQMQERTSPARTKRLTDAFGWGEAELSEQHDIQEMAILLRDRLEQRMKGTVAEGAITQLFEGRGEQFVETLDKSFVSSHPDVFYDIHLPLNGFTNLLDSLTSLTAREQLVGDNRYLVEREGQKGVYQDAERFYVFRRFPPVTWFHLKRITMDLTSPTLVTRKINTRLEFPLELDLTQLERPVAASTGPVTAAAAASPAAAASSPFGASSPALYDLHGVIVHRGTVRSGHYYCYIRAYDATEGRFTHWVEFEDEKVRVVSEEVAVQANYGGAQRGTLRLGGGNGSGGGGGTMYNVELPENNASAYILSYIRRADAARILAPCTRESIPQNVLDAGRRQMAEEQRQLERSLAIKQQLTLCVVTDRSLSQYCGVYQKGFFARDVREMRRYAACVLELKKTDPVTAAYDAIAAQPALRHGGVTARDCRLWRWRDGREGRLYPMCSYAECQVHQIDFQPYLLIDELDRAAVVAVYLQAVSPPPFRPIHLLRQPPCDADGFSVATLATPLLLSGLCVSLQASHVVECNVQLGVTTRHERLVTKTRAVRDGAVYIPLHKPQLVKAVRVQCTRLGGDSPGTGVVDATPVRLPIAALRLDLAACTLPASGEAGSNAPNSTNAAGTRGADGDGSSSSSKGGGDDGGGNHNKSSGGGSSSKYNRSNAMATAVDASGAAHTKPSEAVLLFLKWFDHTTCTVRYVGTVFVDGAAPLRGCETLLLQMLGLPTEPVACATTKAETEHGGSGTGGGGGLTGEGPETAFLRFYEEGRGVITRELSASTSIAELRLHSGAVVVAQCVDMNCLYNHIQVDMYYRTLDAVLQVRLLEVVSDTRDNAAAVRQELQRRVQATASPPPPSSHADGGADATTGDAVAASIVKTAVTAAVDEGGGSESKAAAPSSGAAPLSVLDPFSTMLPPLHVTARRVVRAEVCKMDRYWTYETICDAVARCTGANPACMLLYENAGTAEEPVPANDPVNIDDGRLTLDDLCDTSRDSSSAVLFFERTAEPYTLCNRHCSLSVLLRDRAGYALFRDQFSLPRQGTTLETLVRAVRQAVRRAAWQPPELPRAALQDAVTAPHYVVLGLDKHRPVVRVCAEVDVAAAEDEAAETEQSNSRSSSAAGRGGKERLHDMRLARYDVELIPAAPLQPDEQRVACCHGESNGQDGVLYGHPFFITITRQTTIAEAMEKMLRATHTAREALTAVPHLRILMLANKYLHFSAWDQYLYLYWNNRENVSDHLLNLMLNHPRPREKPGSRYVAQGDPTLRIGDA